MIVEDDAQIRRLLERSLAAPGRELFSAGEGREALALLETADPDALLVDLQLPGASGLEILKAAMKGSPWRAVIILTSHAAEESVVEAMRLGAHDYLSKDMPLEEVEAKVAAALAQALQNKASKAGEPGPRGDSGGLLAGRSPAMLELFKQVALLAPSPVPVLIVGESGTGKEKVARALHAYGPNPSGPFVAVDCASLPSNLLESELFGHEKGAFSGAESAKRGRFEEADGGTLFLDEVGNLSMEASAKLLRALQEKTTQRLGSNKPLKWNARVVSATNADLRAKAREGLYREDLVFRLAGAEIKLPPLRSRPGDLELLCTHFLSQAKAKVAFSPEALALMKTYAWPGNVRELEHTVQHALAASRGQAIRPGHLPQTLREAGALARAGLKPPSSAGDLATLEEVKRQYALYAVEICGGNRAEAAKKLGVDPRTLNSLLGEN